MPNHFWVTWRGRANCLTGGALRNLRAATGDELAAFPRKRNFAGIESSVSKRASGNPISLFEHSVAQRSARVSELLLAPRFCYVHGPRLVEIGAKWGHLSPNRNISALYL